MPWNRDKILTELDRERIPKGVEQALLDRPDLGIDSLCFTLENDGSMHQKTNALRIVLRLLNYRSITPDQVDRVLAQIRAHMDSSDDVGHAACRGAIWYSFVSQAYPHLRISDEERELLLSDALSLHPELESECSSMVARARNTFDDNEPEDGH